MEYARTLSKNKDLALSDIILLDKVQKKYSITYKEEKTLKSKKLIEGRKPNYFIGANVAQKIDQKATYSKNKAFDKQYYLDFILESIKHHGSMNRKDIDELLWNKLPDWMNDKQRKNRITNSITELRKSGKIINDGTFKESVWILKED
jgi:ATP-dependent DNA helicase RecG